MNKRKTARVAAFIGALGASAALIASAVGTTGAYFTDSESGNLAGSTGHLSLDKRNGDYNLNFNNLVPGDYQDRDIYYHTDSDTPEDVWLYFPDGTDYATFSGAKNGQYSSAGGLGRFGHFAVTNFEGQNLFSSYNLANASDTSSGCADDNGHGSGPQATAQNDFPPNCGVPHYMLIETNVPSGSDRKFTMTFGITERKGAQNQSVANVPFEVVGTQHGVRPDAVGH